MSGMRNSGTLYKALQCRIALIAHCSSLFSYLMSINERLMHLHLIGIFEIAADGEAHRDAGDANAERLEEATEIIRGRFAFRIRIGREDDLFDLRFAFCAGAQAFEQISNPQFFRADAANG